MTRNPSYRLFWVSALGALGQEFKSPCPDWLFSEGQNPPWEKIGKMIYFIGGFFMIFS